MIVSAVLGLLIGLALPRPAYAEPEGGLVDALDEGLSILDTDTLQGKTVVLDELSDPSWLTLHATHPAALRTALATAMTRHGLHIESSTAAIHDPVDALRLLRRTERKCSTIKLTATSEPATMK